MLHRLFNPQSIAIIGASDNTTKVGGIILRNLKNMQSRLHSPNATSTMSNKQDNAVNNQIRVYAINPYHKIIQGYKSYKSINSIPEVPDVAVIAIPAHKAIYEIAECIKLRVPFCVVITANIDNIAIDGLNGQDYLLKVRHEYKSPTRIVGPNCMGVINSHINMNLTFAQLPLIRGRTSIISQSGAYISYLLDAFSELNIGTRFIASIGNKIDLNETDLLEFYLNDNNTRIILLYLESITNSMRLRELLLRSITHDKYIVAILSGKSTEAKQAALGHTNSLVPDYKQLKTYLEDAGVIVTQTPEYALEAIYQLDRFTKNHVSVTNKSIIITNAGGPAVSITDILISNDLKLIQPVSELTNLLAANYPNISPSNPLDILGDADTQRYRQISSFITQTYPLEQKPINLFFIATPQHMLETNQLVPTLEAVTPSNIPRFLFTLGGSKMQPAIKHRTITDIIVSTTPYRTINIYSKLYRYSKFRYIIRSRLQYIKNNTHKVSPISGHEENNTSNNIHKLDILNTLKYFKHLKGFLPPQLLIPLDSIHNETNKLRIERFIAKHKKVVVKLNTTQRAHLLKNGLIKLNVDSLEQVYQFITQHNEFQDAIAVIQPQINYLAEGFIGIKYYETLTTHTMALGWGGSFVNHIEDTVLLDMPTTKRILEYKFTQTKFYKVLKKDIPHMVAPFIEMAYRVSNIIKVYPKIKQIDINPVLFTQTNLYLPDIKVFT